MTGPGAAADDTRRHLSQVARGGGLNLVGAGVSAVSGFALVLVVTNSFDAGTAGLFFTATSLFLVLSATATLGTETGLGRFLLRHEAHGRHADVLPTMRLAVRPALALALVLAAALFAFADQVAGLVGLDGTDGTAALRVLALLLPFATWNAVSLGGTRAFGRMRATVVVDKVLRPCAQPLLALLVATTGAGLLWLTLAWALPYALAALVSAVVLHRFLRRRGSFDHGVPNRSRRELRREFWQFTWPRSITRVSQMVLQRIDIVLVAALRSPTEAAVYTAATRFVALGQFGTQAIQQVVEPKFTALLARDENASLRTVFRISAAWSMALAWPLYAVIGAVPVVYLALFGEQYVEDGVAVVVLMSLAMMFAVATGPVDTLLLMSGRSMLSLVNSLTALAIDIVLCLLLIPRMGITGAAVAWAVAVATRAVLAVLQTRFALGIISFGPAAALVAVANLVCFAVPLLVVTRFVEPDAVVLGLTLLGGVPAYALALWFGRRLLELSVLGDLVRRRGRRPAPTGSEDRGA